MSSEVSLEDAAVRELLALSGRGLPLLREWAREDPNCGVARALLMLATGDGLSDAALKQELVVAHRDARAVGPRQASLVHGVFLHTHRHYRLTADHLVRHFAQWPTDEVAGLMLGAFHDCGDPAYREHGDALVEKQYAAAGPDSWTWASWLASVRAEQGRVEEAHELAERALARYPRSGVAAHARAHAEHELGVGPAAVSFLDQWLAVDPGAMNFGHLNWHAALQSIACGDFPDARRRADTALAHSDVGMRAATNWRLLLIGQSPAGRCDLRLVRELLSAPGGMAEVFHTFNLALALAVETATDDLNALAHQAAADQRPDYRDVLAPVAEALAHLTSGHPGAAVDLLAGLGERVERLGGVRVEREIVQDTLARALTDIGEHARAADLLHHRVTTRHHHTYEDLLLTTTENADAGHPIQQRGAPPADAHASFTRSPR
ncbi:tetratricopeptide repeat protein [Streptomyces mayteni]